MIRTLMGFDFGTKRIGIAIGQVITQSASPLPTLQVRSGTPDWITLDKLVRHWQPDAFLIGIPLNMDGSEQPLTQLARDFAQSLNLRYQKKLFEIDERLSTKEVRSRLFAAGGYKALQDRQIDSLAAQLLLENWLSTHSNWDMQE